MSDGTQNQVSEDSTSPNEPTAAWLSDVVKAGASCDEGLRDEDI